MSLAKIDKVKLSQMVMSGKSTKKIAEFFGVTPSAVSQYKARLNGAVVRNVVLESGHKIVCKNLNAIEQLESINKKTNKILTDLMAAMEEEDISESKYKTTRELALKAMGEIRGQLALQLDIFRVLTDVKAVHEFQEEVLNIIGEVDKDAKNKIIARLRARRALRESLSID